MHFVNFVKIFVSFVVKNQKHKRNPNMHFVLFVKIFVSFVVKKPET